MKRLFWTLLGSILVTASAAAAEDQPSAPSSVSPAFLPYTKHNAEAVFFLDVGRCLFSLQDGGGVEALPEQMKASLRPAAASERFLFKDPSVKVWAQDPFGSHVLLAEKSPDRCDVVADQLNVEETFSLTMNGVKRAFPMASEVAVKSSYSDYVHQLEWVRDGMRYIVHLEGAEPGGLSHPDRMLSGHAYRFSLLNAFVVKQPESAKPPFR